MSNPLGPIRVECDAPPYSVVEASVLVGIEAPADVPWHRLGNLPQLPSAAQLQVRQAGVSCRCGHALSDPCVARFSFLGGAEADYLLAQCKRCHAVYWELVGAGLMNEARAE